jgi:hypothetical protein
MRYTALGLCALVLVVIVCSLPSPAVSNDSEQDGARPKQNPPAPEKRCDDATRPERFRSYVKDAKKARLAEINKQLKQSRIASDFLRAERRRVTRKDWIPPLDPWPNQLAAGQFGSFQRRYPYGVVAEHEVHVDPGDYLWVVQVIDENQMLVRDNAYTGRRRADRWFMIRGMSTDGLVDDVALNPGDTVFEVCGTHTYETALGGSNTVWVLEAVDLTAMGAKAAEKKPKKKPTTSAPTSQTVEKPKSKM